MAAVNPQTFFRFAADHHELLVELYQRRDGITEAELLQLVQEPAGTVTRKGKFMGVTIHYRGKLDDPARVEDLRSELADIAKSIGWKWQTLDDDWAIQPRASLVHSGGVATIKGHLGLKGIIVTSEGPSESLNFLFDANGRLSSAMNVILEGEGRITQDQAWNSVRNALPIWPVCPPRTSLPESSTSCDRDGPGTEAPSKPERFSTWREI